MVCHWQVRHCNVWPWRLVKGIKGSAAVVIQHFRQVDTYCQPHPHWHLQQHRNFSTNIIDWSSRNRFFNAIHHGKVTQVTYIIWSIRTVTKSSTMNMSAHKLKKEGFNQQLTKPAHQQHVIMFYAIISVLLSSDSRTITWMKIGFFVFHSEALAVIAACPLWMCCWQLIVCRQRAMS